MDRANHTDQASPFTIIQGGLVTTGWPTMAFFSFLSWFRPWWKAAETDYETVLARLTKDIQGVQARLVRVNQRERRTSVQMTLYAILVWWAYAVFIWYSTADTRPHLSKGQRFRLWIPIVLGLVLIFSARSIVRWWFRRVADGEEKHLRSLQRARRKKIDEIKQATKFDHLRSLLERYDDTTRPGGMRRGTSTLSTTSNRSQQTASTQTAATQNRTAAPTATGARSGAKAQGNAPSTTAESRGIPLAPITTDDRTGNKGAGPSTNVPPSALPFDTPQKPVRFQKTWLDRLADRLLGVETLTEGGPEQRYALICPVCLSHNGLCPKEDWEEVQYICPRCGTFNSRRPSSAPQGLRNSLFLPNPPTFTRPRASSVATPSVDRPEQDDYLSPTTASQQHHNEGKATLSESVSAPSNVGSSSFWDDEGTQGEEEIQRSLSRDGQGEAGGNVESEQAGSEEDDHAKDEVEDSQAPARRWKGTTTARQEEKRDPLRKRLPTASNNVGDESTEPMQLDTD